MVFIFEESNKCRFIYSIVPLKFVSGVIVKVVVVDAHLTLATYRPSDHSLNSTVEFPISTSIDHAVRFFTLNAHLQ